LANAEWGDVYRATDTTLNREVAIKVLPVVPSAAEERAPRPFRREAQILATLNHANIAAIYGSRRRRRGGVRDVDGRRLFEGETLSDVIAAVLTREPDCRRSPRWRR